MVVVLLLLVVVVVVSVRAVEAATYDLEAK